MSYLLISDFKGGLDRRRHALTSVPGTLQILKNGHITRGGEIERCKKFAEFATLPPDTFGLEAGRNEVNVNQLFVFGSAEAPAHMPTGTVYQRLAHPDGATAMDGVNFSTLYGGAPFVLAHFTNGDVFAYYDGELVDDWKDGLVMATTDARDEIAVAVAALINADTASGYSASASGDEITITGQNNKPFTCEWEFTAERVEAAYSEVPPPVDATHPQVTTVKLTETAQLGDTFMLRITDTGTSIAHEYGAGRVTGLKAVCACTLKSKEYVCAGTVLAFSAVDQPTLWEYLDVGAGVINIFDQIAGAEDLVAVANYQNNLAVFSQRNIQIWFVDPAPANNRVLQILSNIGTVAAKSVAAKGDSEVCFLSDAGIRSLNVRDASNSAMIHDIGVPIDDLVLAHLADLSAAQKAAAAAIVEPKDGRYWLALPAGEHTPSRIYVLSDFPASGIRAWSTYEPGFDVDKFLQLEGRVYARSTDGNIYLYGGAEGNEYDTSPARQMEVVLPLLDASRPATEKHVTAIDGTMEGKFLVYLGTDPSVPNARDHIAELTQPTFALGRILAMGIGTHFGFRLVTKGDIETPEGGIEPGTEYARLGNLIVHFETGEAG